VKRSMAYLALILLAGTGYAGVPEAGDEVNAKLARIKSVKAAVSASKNSDENNADANSTSLLDNGCNIAIGNIFESGRGASTSAKRETTVIVTGDVIQAGNNCNTK